MKSPRDFTQEDADRRSEEPEYGQNEPVVMEKLIAINECFSLYTKISKVLHQIIIKSSSKQHKKYRIARENSCPMADFLL